jgi:ElaB/YqjD/DUF883 family membrane-anchored ribosome-binding protein
MEQTGMWLYIIFLIATIAGMWKTFEKAGEAGWKAIIPIYNLIVLMKIIRKPWWWALLMLIPYLGVIWSVWSTNLLSKSFGKELGYTLGLIFLPFIFYPLLGFGDAKYQALDSEGSSVADAFHGAIDDIQEAADDAKNAVADMKEDTQERFKDMKEEAGDMMDDFQKRTADTVDKAANMIRGEEE